MTSFRQRSDAFASLPSQPVGRKCCEMCHACCSSQHSQSKAYYSQSKAYSPHHSSEQSQSKKWRPGRRGAGEVVWTLVAVLAFVSSVGDAMPRRSVGPGAPEQDNKLMGYLESFGYLPEVKGGPGSLRSADQLKDALRNLQAFAGLPATGQLDVETQQLLQRPRCGLPDISLQHARRKRRKRYAVQGQKWHTLNITWSLQTQRLLSLEHGKVRRELHRALDLWAQNSQLTFREVASENADIVINFHRGYHGDGYPFDGQGLILAHAFFPGPGRGGDVHFDEDEVWQVDGDSNQVGGTSLFSVAAHEFGHSLGLSHSSVVGALMYPWYHGLVDSYRLPEDDRHGIQQLYGSKGKLWAKIPVYTPSNDDGYHPRRHHPTSPPLTSSTTTTTSTTTANPRPDEPATCDTTYDAVSVIRSEVFIFKEKYMWRISDKGLMTGYPALITRLWSHLPKDLTHIDAAYERTDKKIVFFIGRHYYVFRGNTLERGYPQPLTSLGLPHSLEKVDSAFVWGHNSKTYIFAGDKYWKLDDEEGRVERDYPRDMSVWKGVGYPVDAVFQWKDGATYFFKGKSFWKFNDILMRVENERPRLSAPFWMGCPRPKIDQATERTDTKTGSLATALSPVSVYFTVILITVHSLLS